MSNKIKPTIKPISVEREYEYAGVKVNVLIDFHNETISLIEKREKFQSTTPAAKKYIFANRGVEYMNGWHNVLKALEECIKMAAEELQEYLEAKELTEIQQLSKTVEAMNNK